MNRNTGLRPRIAGVDALVVAPVALFVYHPRWWTLIVLGIVVGVLWTLEQYGVMVTSLAPLVRWWIGARRPDLHAREKDPFS